MNCYRFRDIARQRPTIGAIGYTVLLLLCAAASVNAAPARAPMADAAERLDRSSVRALISQRVDVNAPQPDGMTALHWAAYQDDLDLATLLVRAGANVKAA